MLSSLQVCRYSTTRSSISALRSSFTPKRCLSNQSKHDPLRILFCGADEFSIYSLRALNKIRLDNPDKVASLDIVCRKDKRVGRGLKQIREVPIKKVAGSELGLNVHQIDTFTRWTPPQPFNLVVAVSFGLLVPPRILNAAKYGGLNVHPSMLPDLRGPAPLHHTLLRRLKRTGVTLQTLHPKHFDHGIILARTAKPGLPIPDLGNATLESLLAWIGPLGADMLYKNVMNGRFASTLPESTTSPPNQKEHSSAAMDAKSRCLDLYGEDVTAGDIFGQLTHTQDFPRNASKITPEHRELSFSWPVDEILLRDRVLGRLFVQSLSPLTSKRATFHGFKNTTHDFLALSEGRDLKSSDADVDALSVPLAFRDDPERRIFFQVRDGYVSPSEITIDGKPKQAASSFHRLCTDSERTTL